MSCVCSVHSRPESPSFLGFPKAPACVLFLFFCMNIVCRVMKPVKWFPNLMLLTVLVMLNVTHYNLLQLTIFTLDVPCMFELLGYAPLLDFRITPFFVKVSSKRTQMIKEKNNKISLFSVLENKKNYYVSFEYIISSKV